MSWDPVWEEIFRSREWGKYPPEELVRFVARRYYSVPNRSSVRILELGCGPGGGPSWFLAREGFAVSGIDGSPTAIDQARARFREEKLQGEFIVGGLDRVPWADSTFDCAVDVACLQCNTETETAKILDEMRRVLKPGGRHLSITARAGSWGDGAGRRLDATTFSSVSEGPFANIGTMRFATRESLAVLYAGFQEVAIEYETRSFQNGTRQIANWIVTCRKAP